MICSDQPYRVVILAEEMADILFTTGEKLVRSDFERGDFPGHIGYQHFNPQFGGPNNIQESVRAYRPKKASKGLFKRKSKDIFGGSHDR